MKLEEVLESQSWSRMNRMIAITNSLLCSEIPLNERLRLEVERDRIMAEIKIERGDENICSKNKLHLVKSSHSL